MEINNLPPVQCFGTKCMIPNCDMLAEHKIGELNIFDQNLQKEQYYSFNQRHSYTTYLCDYHFNSIMDRHVTYFKTDDRFPDDYNK